MSNSPKLEIIIGAKADQLKAALADLAQSLNAVSRQANQAGAQTAGAFQPAEAQLGRTRAGVQSISEQLAGAKAQLIGFFSIQYGIGLAKDLIQTADAVTNMNARLKLATQTSAEYTTAQKALSDISQRTASSIESNVTLYARVADSMRAMGKTQQEALVFTEEVGQAMRVSGASAESAKAGITQLAQAMASGVLRGDEFNSIMENSPRLARALADGLDVPIGKLRDLAEAGQLTAQKVVSALLSQKDELAAEYATIPLTVGASLTQLANAWTQYLGQADQAEGATKSLALVISDISKNFSQYADTILSAGRDALVILAGFGAVKLSAAVAEFAALIGAMTRAAAAADLAAPAVGRLSLATGLLSKALGPLLLAFLAFEGLKVAGQWLGEFAAKLVVGETGVKKFSSGVEAGMEVAQAATSEMKGETADLAAEIDRSNRLAAFSLVGESVQAAKAKVEAATAAMLKAFDEIATKSGDVGKALQQIADSADLKTSAGLDALFAALEKLQAEGKITGEQVHKALQNAIGKMDVTALVGFQMALQNSSASGQALADTLDRVVGAALKKLGTDALSVNSGLSKAFRDTEQTFHLLTDNAKATGAEIKFAFDKMLDAAKTKQEAEALKAEFEHLKEFGKLSAAEIKDEYAKLQAKLNETAGQIDGALGDAFKRLGIKTAAAMKAAFDQLVTDFNDIKKSGQAAAEGIDQAYQKIKSSVIAQITAMTTASREALDAARQHTATVQAAVTAEAARTKFTEASAAAEKALLAAAQAEAQAQKTGTEAAKAKAEALGLVAQATQQAKFAAWEEVAAQQAVAAAVKATELASRAAALAAKEPTEAHTAAAAAAQNTANALASTAEEAKQSAIEAKGLADEMQSAASAANTAADGMDRISSSAKADANVLQEIKGATIDYVAIMQQGYDSLAQKGVSLKQVATDMAATDAANFNAMASRGAAYNISLEDTLSRIRATGRILAEAEAATKRNEEATRAWATAMDSLRGIAASLKDELDRALGNDKAIEDRAYADKKKAIEDQYTAAIKAAEQQAAYTVAGIAAQDKARSDARAAYDQALADLSQLHGIKIKNISDEAAAKAAADRKAHQDEMARIAAEQAAKAQTDALLTRVATQSGTRAAAASSSASTAASSASSGGGTTINTLNVNVDGSDLLSEEQIRTKIVPVLNRILTGAR